MGGGAKEKSQRAHAAHVLDAELAGVRLFWTLAFVALLGFSALFLSRVSDAASEDEDQRSAAAVTKIVRQRSERARARARATVAAGDAAADGKTQVAAAGAPKDAVPEWVTPRLAKKKKERRKDAEWGEEEAEVELRMQMVDWIRDAQSEAGGRGVAGAGARERASAEEGGEEEDENEDGDAAGSDPEGRGTPPPESDSLVRLRKRQQLVEEAVDAVVDPSFDVGVQALLTGRSPASAKDGGEKGDGKEGAATTARDKRRGAALAAKRVAPNPEFRSLRASNFFVSTSSRSSAFEEWLLSIGYSRAAAKTPWPLWVLGLGSKCPTEQELPVAQNERHVLLCTRYVAAAPQVPRSAFTQRSGKAVFLELLSAPTRGGSAGAGSGSGSGGVALSAKSEAVAEALGEAFDPASFTKSPGYRLGSASDRAKIEAILARDADTRPLFVLESRDGTRPVLVDNVNSMLASWKRLESRGYSLHPLDVRPPALADGRPFVVRCFLVVFDSDPLMVLFREGPALVAPAAFKRPATAAASNAGEVFPGPRWEAFPSWADALGDAAPAPAQRAALAARMRQIATFVLLALGVAHVPVVSEKRVLVQHLCLDFTMDLAPAASAAAADDGARSRRTLLLDAVKTGGCEFSDAAHAVPLVQHVSAIAEELMMRKARQEPLAFATLAAYPDAQQAGLEVLVDEARERASGKSLIDAVASLVAAGAGGAHRDAGGAAAPAW